MIMAAAFFIVIMVMVMLMGLFQQFLGQISLLVFHNSFDLGRLQLLHRSGNDAGSLVQSADQLDGFLYLFLIRHIGTTQNDRSCIGDLIREKFSEISQIHLAFFNIGHSSIAVQYNITFIFYVFYGFDNVGQLTNAGGLDDDPVRMILFHHFNQRCAKVSYQRTADTAGIHLSDLYTGLF